MSIHHLRIRSAATVLAMMVAATIGVMPAGSARFLPDDPLVREPETQDASGVQEWDIDLFVDLTINLFSQPGDPTVGVHARDVNTVDEVPDSSWFTNRILARPLTIDEVMTGPRTGPGPANGPLTITSAKESGFAPGFTAEDSAGERWFISFDAKGFPEASTGAILVANKIFWALGYWQVDNQLTQIWPEQITIGKKATVRPMSGKRRPMLKSDLDDVWRRANRSADGSYRAIAARALPGKPLGGFRYYGTRPDDPNDVVPHEHRRALRALQVFGAWANLVDMKAGNTLDMLITESGRGKVRHYLQDVGSTFGTGANGPREYDEGWEHLFEGDLVLKRLVTLGFVFRPWQTAHYEDVPEIGPFEGDVFDPPAWKPRVPTAALRHTQPDDLFWAARRVAAFSDEMIRAIAESGRYSDPAAARHLADVLIKRRDKIAAAYLPAVNPMINPAMAPDGAVTFDNAAVAARVAQQPRGGYRVTWATFDNTTHEATALGETTISPGARALAPRALPAGPGSFVRVSVTAIDTPREAWLKPAHAYFRRTAGGWVLVGLDRSGA